MPAIHFINSKEDLKIVVWRLLEDPTELELSYNLKKDFTYKNLSEKRKREFLGKSFCLDFLGIKEKIKYQKNGKPYLENSNCISISHSGNIICVAISHKPIGVDVEKFNPEKILNLQKKFVGDLEEKWLSKKENLASFLHLIWGAKECLYKITNQQGIIWKQQMRVDEFSLHSNGRFDCWMIENNSSIKYEAHYKMINEYFLVWVV